LLPAILGAHDGQAVTPPFHTLRLLICASLAAGSACAPPNHSSVLAEAPAAASVPLSLTHEAFIYLFPPSDLSEPGHHAMISYGDLEGDAALEALVCIHTNALRDSDHLLLFTGDRQSGWTLLHDQPVPGIVSVEPQEVHRLGDRRWIESTWHGSGTGELQASTCLLEYRDGAFAPVTDSVTYLEFGDYPTGMCLQAQAGPYQIVAEGAPGAVQARRQLTLSALPARDFELESVDFAVTLIYRQSAPGMPFELVEPAGLGEADCNGLVRISARRWIAEKWEVARRAALEGSAAEQETLRSIALRAGEDEWAAELRALLPPAPDPSPDTAPTD
jgi:hypothetical protein